ncbi:PAS domain S-box protein [Mucilaginibacter sp. 14171R-50]|uniref:PAS domain S-box protein n=1 Tax=Mucilaginibacter sp. 14171R-50 TaxID=2703789 RepID=UPI00138C6BB9|nr:PAS domain S-box protein [Mucilaginibacter sp. 14171R-50]QHS55817.1 PAS domain S-box protein [Mucilaginibacter sp. 14171R-50]
MSISLHHIWKVYKIFGKNALKDNSGDEVESLTAWRENLFIKIILYSTPASLVALIPSVIILLNKGHVFIPAYDVFAIITIPAISLNQRIKTSFKKLYVVIVFYVLAIIVMVSLGSFGMGSIYLLALAVFITLLFNGRAILLSLVVNFGIYLFFAGVIYFRLFNSPLIAMYPLDTWVFITSNFIFLNIAVVIVLRHIIIGLEKNIIKEARLRHNLQRRIAETTALNAQLTETESHYKSLFFRNPSPMWIFDPDTLQFLQVNGAAIRQYGFTREEFNTMTIKDIRPPEKIGNLIETLEQLDHNVPSISTVIHKAKNGKEFHVEVRCSSIVYRGKSERLVIARDITESILYTQAIEKQNTQLREIAYMQSHIVRAPLCRILGLIPMINADSDSEVNKEIISFLETSAQELDSVIKAIVDRTENTDIDLKQ